MDHIRHNRPLKQILEGSPLRLAANLAAAAQEWLAQAQVAHDDGRRAMGGPAPKVLLPAKEARRREQAYVGQRRLLVRCPRYRPGLPHYSGLDRPDHATGRMMRLPQAVSGKHPVEVTIPDEVRPGSQPAARAPASVRRARRKNNTFESIFSTLYE